MTEKDLIIQDLRRETAELRARVQEWISVEDRLPEIDGADLGTTNVVSELQNVKTRWFAKDGEMVDAYDLAGQKDVWYLYDIECGYVSIKTVTHWMPLPEPPKGE